MREINVGIIGLGTVGAGTARLLGATRAKTRVLEDVDIRIAGAADVRPDAFKGLGIPRGCRTDNWESIARGEDIDVVCELVGGNTTAYEIITAALLAGKHVVTANKALLAERGLELFSLAREKRVLLRFEASVAGGVPILRAVREGLCANEISSVAGILNGTSNYILHSMQTAGLSFREALAEAQKNGFAEADPTLDVGGFDAAHKLTILAALAFHTWIPRSRIAIEGIDGIGVDDVAYAAELGYAIKSLAIARHVEGALEASVGPAMIPRDDMLAGVPREYNAVLVHGDATGPTLYFGKGAGRFPTASSVVADIIDIARDTARGSPYRLDPMPLGDPLPVRPAADLRSRYYIRFVARDLPGVIGTVGSILGRRGISIASVMQKEPVGDGSPARRGTVPVVILVHRTRAADMRAALAQMRRLSCVRGRIQLLRIEERGE